MIIVFRIHTSVNHGSLHVCVYRRKQGVSYASLTGCDMIVCTRFGRRRSLIAYYAVSGVALIISQVIPEQAGKAELPFDVLLCTV